MTIDDWEAVPIQTAAARGTAEWSAVAFGACTAAYRCLQRRHPDADVVFTLELPPGIKGALLPPRLRHCVTHRPGVPPDL